ncbi:jerky protein homolog-like isoform X2 [Acanthaster planci]|uniref:Jerky protein homolog-like isoform X2 n=1 Tax=Acanthaster planci TaxID=133434 RepID=A0A8B7ZXN4_ACAPL|nr:jerky protein homolog-like isoform X2 [Acanthaster planci]
MPRQHYKEYKKDTLETAVNKIRNGEMTIRGASRLYNIPKTTLNDKVNYRSLLHSRQGPKPVLTEEEENQLVRWIIGMSKIGYGRTKLELLSTVKKILDKDGRPNRFRNNTPGRDWLKGFLCRHSELAPRMPQILGRERACVTIKKIHHWFDMLEEYFEKESEEGLQIFEDPMRIFNADESGFPLADGQSDQALAPKGARNVCIQGSSVKSQITVLACANAGGLFMPPMMVFSGMRFHFKLTEGGPDGTIFCRSEHGLMDSALFYKWTANHFLPFVKTKSIKLPVILFVNGNSTHINLQTVEFCKQNKIILYCLPLYTTHVMQPLAVSFFRSVEMRWSQDIQEYQMTHPGAQLTKRTFASVFRLSWEGAATATNAVSGFRKCGLFPLNREAIEFGNLQASTTYHLPELHPLPEVVQDPEPPTKANKNTQEPSHHALEGFSPTAARLALNAIEALVSPQKLRLFSSRRLEGYDLVGDDLYNVWRALSDKADREPTASDPSVKPGPSDKPPAQQKTKPGGTNGT